MIWFSLLLLVLGLVVPARTATLTESSTQTVVVQTSGTFKSILSTDCGGPKVCPTIVQNISPPSIGTVTSFPVLGNPTGLTLSPTGSSATKAPNANPRPTIKPSTVSSAPTISSDPFGAKQFGISKSNVTAIIAGVLTPIVVVAICVLVYFIRKSRNRKKADILRQKNRPVISRPIPMDPIPGRPPSPPYGPSPPPFKPFEATPPPVPSKSPENFHDRSAPPRRPARPTSLTESLAETMASPPPGSYLHGATSDMTIDPYDSSSQRGLDHRYASHRNDVPSEFQHLPGAPSIYTTSESTAHPHNRDNSRDLFARVARERDFDHTQLARESLQLSGNDLERYLTPPALLIRKKSSGRSDPTDTHLHPPSRTHSDRSTRSRDPPSRSGSHRTNRGITPTDRGLRGGVPERHDQELGYSASEPAAGPSRSRPERPESIDYQHAVSEIWNASLMNDSSDDGNGERDIRDVRRHRAETYVSLTGERPSRVPSFQSPPPRPLPPVPSLQPPVTSQQPRVTSSIYSNDSVWTQSERPEEQDRESEPTIEFEEMRERERERQEMLRGREAMLRGRGDVKDDLKGARRDESPEDGPASAPIKPAASAWTRFRGIF